MDIFPTLNGLDWNAKKIPTWNTLIVKAASGREVRTPLQTLPIWHFELMYAYLKDGLGGLNDLKTLMAFYNRQLGGFQAWLYQDPNDFQVTNQSIGTGDGTTKAFQLFRTIQGTGFTVNEPFKDIQNLTVKVNGTLTSAFTGPDANGIITFTAAPASLAPITATFQFFFRVRFEDDQLEFNNIMQQLFEAQSVKFVSAR